MKSCQEHRMSNNNHSKDDGFESFVAFDSLLNTLDGAALVSTRNMKQKRKPKNKMTATKNSNTKFQLKQNYYSTAKRLKIEASSQSILDGVKMIREPNRSKVSQYLNEIKPGKDSNHDVCINGNRNQIFIKPTHTASELLNCSNLNNNNVKKQGVHPVTNKKIVTENSDSVNLKNPTNQSLPMTIHDCKSHHPLYKKISFENHNNRFFNTVQINESSVINSIQKHDDTQTPGATNGMENALMTNQNNGHLTKNPTYQSCSWVSKLYSQSILSHENRLRKIGKYTSTVTARLNSNPHQVHPNQYSVSHLYTPSDTVRLDLGTSSSSSLTSCFVTCMDFDQDGTYLAVGDSLGYVRIYDFEEIHAADISNSRQFHTSKNAKNNGIKRRKILPCVMFHTGNHRISNIAWCPPSSDDHPAIGQDLLAVSFSNYREVRIYDLSIASESGPRFIALNDSSNVRGSGHSFITFLNDAKATKSTGTNDHPLYLLAGGSDGTVRLWCVPKNVEGKVKLLWSFNPWNSYECGVISDIIQLTSFHPTQKKGLVLISTSMGYFAIINLDRLVHKSFSVSGTPEVISTWSLSQVNELHNTGLPKDCKWIGVKRCFSMTQLVSYKKLSLDFLIVTNAGWVLSMKTIIEKSKSYVVSSRPKCQVLHQTPKMETYSSTGEYYGQDQSTSCVPSFNSIAYYQDSNIPTLIITGIKPNRKYLASSDCRVLDSSSSSPILREPNELLLLNARSLQTLNGTTASNTTTASSSVDNCTEKNRHSIRLVHGSPTHVAIHPGNGFIVVATAQGVGGVLQSSMELLSLRKSRRRDC
jgi:hypothetical protein